MTRDDDRRLGIGLVGLGYWGPNLLRVLAEIPGARVTHACDIDDGRLQRMADRYPSVTATRRYEDLLEDPAVDAIVVATPVFTHHQLASQSLAAGKHTFVEKPLAGSTKDASELMRLASDNDLVLMCGHTFLYSPPVRAVKKLLDEDAVGDIHFISSSRVNLGLHQRDVSVVWDLGPHDFSILLYWLGERPTSVRAIGRDSIVPGTSDVAFIDLKFPSGVLAHTELSWLAPSKLRRTVIVGSKSMVVYEDGGVEPVRVFDHGVVYRDPETFGEYHLSYRTGDIVSPRVDTAEPLALELEDFVAIVASGDAAAAGVELAHDVVGLIEAAETSMGNGGEQVQFNPVSAAG